MNNDVAIKIIKNRIDEHTRVLRYLTNESPTYESLASEIEALLKANEALESKSEVEEYRKPKDVIKRVDRSTDGKPLNIYECPTCKRVLASHEGNAYCRFCGQALKWPTEVSYERL